MNKLILIVPYLSAMVVGAMLPFQATGNAAAGRLLGHALWGTLLSLLVSIAVLLPALWLFRVPTPRFAEVMQGPWWLWVGGALGALYISSAVLLIPKLGAASFIVCVIVGQIVIAAALDHFGLMGLPVKPITLARAAGILLILAGVFMVSYSGKTQPQPLTAPVEAPHS